MPPLFHGGQFTFAGGEFGPSLHARVDIQKYLSGLMTGRNVTVLPHGGARNRPGTKYVASAGDSAHPVRLIPFVSSSTVAYVIELGHYYARFFTNSAQVQATPVAYASTSSYQAAAYVKLGAYWDVDFGSGKHLYINLPYGGNPTSLTVAVATNNGGDTLSIGGSVAILLANSTASKNSAALIQTGVRALGGQWANAVVTENAAYAAARPTSGVSTITPTIVFGDKYYKCILASIGGLFPPISTSNFTLVTATPYEIVTPWDSADIFDLKFCQSADTLFVAHKDYAPQAIVFNSSTDWTISNYYFSNGPFMIENSEQSRTLTPSATTIPTTTLNISSVISVGPYYPGHDLVYIETSAPHGLSSYTSTTKIESLDGALASQLNGNTYKVYVISTTRIQLINSDLSALSVTSFSTYTPGTGTITIPSGSPVTLTANFSHFVSGQVGAQFQLVSTIPANTVAKSITGTGQFSTAIQCGHDWSIITAGGWTGIVNVQVSIDNGVTWTTIQVLQSNGSDNYQTSGDTGYDQCIIRVLSGNSWAGTAATDLSSRSFDWHGTVQIISISSVYVAVVNILDNGNLKTGLANTNSTWQWSEGSWSDYRGWPSCVTFFQDRLTWAGTKTEPQTIWNSRTASYSDFSTSSPLQADDGFSILLPSRQLNAIHNLEVMAQGMVALTTDSEWMVAPGGSGYSAASVDVNLQGHRGSSKIEPVVVGIELLLMQQMGTICRNLIYQLAVNGFFGDNISIMSQHLFTGYTIKEMAYAQEPDSILYAVRSDGKLLTCTYMRDQEMNAWTWHDTDGTFESVQTIPNTTLGYNQPWFIVKRGSVRMIEYLPNRDGMGAEPEDQFFVDSGVTYDDTPTLSITGLSHLEGKSVTILADGNVVPSKTVSGGEITLDNTASVVHVGLQFVSDVQTLRIEAPNQRGTAQGRRVVIPEVTIRFWNSRGGYVKGMSDDIATPASTGVSGFDEIVERQDNDDPTVAMPLRTKDYKVTVNGGYDFGCRVWYRQVDPLPFTILAFLPKTDVSES